MRQSCNSVEASLAQGVLLWDSNMDKELVVPRGMEQPEVGRG